MSHITKIKLQLTNVDALKAALKEMGYTPRDEVKEILGESNERADCDFAVRSMSGDYDIGFKRNGDKFDVDANWDMIDEQINGFLDRLKQRYAVAVAKADAKSRGFLVVRETVESDGSVRLVLRRRSQPGEITTSIGNDGSAQVKVSGVTGTGCVGLTSGLERALGGEIVKRCMTTGASVGLEQTRQQMATQ